MKQFTVSLDESLQRPVMRLADWYGFDAMLDTGAIFPIWIDSEELLKATGATLVMKEAEFGGIGGRATGNVYQLPYFKIGELIFPNMHIICYPMEKKNCHLLLSSTMFYGLRCEIDFENHKLNVTIPDKQPQVRTLRIEDQNGHLHVFCQEAE